MTQEEKKLEEWFEGHYREADRPINIPKIVEIAEKLKRLEAETRMGEALVG